MYVNLYRKHIGSIGIFGNNRMTTHYYEHLAYLLKLQKFNHKPLEVLDSLVKDSDKAYETIHFSQDGVMTMEREMCDFYGCCLGYDDLHIVFVPELLGDDIELFL